jgi:hypothetical protein
MAGTVVVGALNTSSGILSTNNISDGIAKAWVNFQGGGTAGYTTNTAGVINGSFNVSSITVNAAADYSINFATPMTDSNYVASGICNFDGSSSYYGRYPALCQNFATYLRVQTVYDYNAPQAAYICMIIVIGKG